MTDLADRYRRLAERFTAVVADVPDGAWGSPSPCERWTARDVVAHVVDGQHGFLERFDRAPARSGAPVADWPAVRDAMQSCLEDPAIAGIEFDGMFGAISFASTVDQFMCADLVVHAWDLARAAGLTEHEAIPADEIERLRGELQQLGPAMRSPGVFGPEVPVGDDASEQDRFLAFIGRQP